MKDFFSKISGAAAGAKPKQPSWPSSKQNAVVLPPHLQGKGVQAIREQAAAALGNDPNHLVRLVADLCSDARTTSVNPTFRGSSPLRSSGRKL